MNELITNVFVEQLGLSNMHASINVNVLAERFYSTNFFVFHFSFQLCEVCLLQTNITAV